VREVQQASPPALNTRLKLAANAVTQPFEHMENEVQQALVVMEIDTGWLLNYRQLICNPKYKKAWNLSAANKFGQLAQGAGNCIKRTNTIKFIHKCKVPKSRLEDVTYGLLSAPNDLKKQNRIEPVSPLEGIKLTTQGR
jgi:hypothetical protein